MSPAFDHQALPAELWLEIFAYLDDRSYSVSYAPFEFIPGIPAEDVNNAYAAVVLVCRNWHDWAISSLYRILKIPDSDSAWVAWVQNHPEYGQWVQRIVLRYTAAISRAQTAEFTGILRLCPNVIALIRPHSQRARALFEPAVPCPPLLSLKRLEWWNYSANSPMDGINSLLSAVAAAPNLEYLFIGLQSPHTMNFSPVPLPKIELPRLRTLRLGVANVHLRTIAEWTLPALDTLIMETPLVTVGLTALWASHGPQLRVVELGEHDGFLGDQYLTSCLRGCPALRELNYHLFSTALPPMHVATDTYPSVTTVGLHVAPAANLKLAEEQAHLKRHCAALGSIFPSLERLRIYGGLESLLGDKRFPSMLQRLIDRGPTPIAKISYSTARAIYHSHFMRSVDMHRRAFMSTPPWLSRIDSSCSNTNGQGLEREELSVLVNAFNPTPSPPSTSGCGGGQGMTSAFKKSPTRTKDPSTRRVRTRRMRKTRTARRRTLRKFFFRHSPSSENVLQIRKTTSSGNPTFPSIHLVPARPPERSASYGRSHVSFDPSLTVC